MVESQAGADPKTSMKNRAMMAGRDALGGVVGGVVGAVNIPNVPTAVPKAMSAAMSAASKVSAASQVLAASQLQMYNMTIVPAGAEHNTTVSVTGTNTVSLEGSLHNPTLSVASADPKTSMKDRMKMAEGDVLSGVADNVDNPIVSAASQAYNKTIVPAGAEQNITVSVASATEAMVSRHFMLIPSNKTLSESE